VLDELLVVRRHRGEPVGPKRRLQQPDVRSVDVSLVRIRDLRRLEVGALHEAEVGRQRKQRREISLRAEQVGLEDGADVPVAALTQPAVDPKRGVDVARLLHVDADEVAQLPRVSDELRDVALCELLVDREAKVRELERDVRPQTLRGDPIQHPAV